MSTRKTTLFYAILIAVASMSIGMVIASRLDLSPSSSAQTFSVPPANRAPITGAIDADTFREIAEAQTPMVVNIRTESRRRTQELTDFFGGEDLFRRFFGQPLPRQRPRDDITEGAGTGFIIDADGFILTNNHVVEGATKIEVGFFGDELGDVYEAELVGRDQLTDSALIRLIEKPDRALPAATFGDSAQMQPGDWVMAIGNPFNLAHTVTVGVISATGRPFWPVEGRTQAMLQTDTAINPGNSGGPLLNIRGEVVGINTAIFTDQGRASNIGIGFAVPINAVRELLPQLRTGKVTRGRIGVQITGVSRGAAEGLGLTERMGAVVSAVEEDSPAAEADIQPGDVIVEYNGRPVAGTEELVQMVIRTQPGTRVPIEVIRNKEPVRLTVTIGELDLEQEEQTRTAELEELSTGFGMTLTDLTAETARQLRVPRGTTGALILEVEPRGPAARAGMQRGDVIIEVNRSPVASASEATRELRSVQSGQTAFLLVVRRGRQVFVQVTKD